VEYIYEQPGDAAAPTDNGELTAAMLAELPADLLQDLDETTLVANRAVILEVIERIAEHAPETAKHLRAFVQNFSFDQTGRSASSGPSSAELLKPIFEP